MDAIIRVEERRNGPHRVFARASIASTFLPQGSLARVLSERLHALSIDAKRKRRPPKRFSPSKRRPPIDDDDDNGDDVDMPQAAPEAVFDLLPPEMIDEVMLDTLDPRNMGMLQPTIDAVEYEAYKEQIVTESRRLLQLYGFLLGSRSTIREVVLSRGFRTTLYRRWYRAGTLFDRWELHTHQETLVFTIPEPPVEYYRWYRTLLYDAILAEHMILVTWSASRIVVSRGKQRKAIERAYQQATSQRGGAMGAAGILLKPDSARSAADKAMMRHLKRGGMLVPGAMPLAFDSMWYLAVLRGGIAFFPGSELLSLIRGGWFTKPKEWAYFLLLQRALLRSDIWRIPQLSMARSKRRSGWNWYKDAPLGGYYGQTFLLRGTGTQQVLLDNFVPEMLGGEEFVERGSSDAVYGIHFEPCLIPRRTYGAEVEISAVRLMQKSLCEEWLSLHLDRSRAGGQDDPDSKLLVRDVFHRRGDKGLIPGSLPIVKDGTLTLILEQTLRGIKPSQLEPLKTDATLSPGVVFTQFGVETPETSEEAEATDPATAPATDPATDGEEEEGESPWVRVTRVDVYSVQIHGDASTV